ncbi:MAG TPA: NAD(P)H-dependent oxidoreductase [Gemmatimonadales bacterium]|nr:NAD(P)H-dependent oxidoreductase [Gemmatimonadales bacterium]
MSPAPTPNWIDAGAVDDFAGRAVAPVMLNGTRIAIVQKDGQFSAISGTCNHVGGPLGEGTLEGDYVVCPWHYYKFHRVTGEGEPGYEADKVPSFTAKVEGGRVWVDLASKTRRGRIPHEPHPLAREVVRAEGPIRVAGISTTNMTKGRPRFSTSEHLLQEALAHAREDGCETKMHRLSDLSFRACEGFYSKSAHACTWPCSITQLDPDDQLEEVYESFVHWADVILIATPIRWGQPSALYHKMVERMNCIQNQETIADKHLVKNKVVGMIITGGQDNVQGVAGGMLSFFAELGCTFPQYPYIAHTRGWSAEDMENNVKQVAQSEVLKEASRALADRCIEMAQLVVSGQMHQDHMGRGGRKGHALDV